MKKKFLFRFPVGTDTRKAWAYLKENDIDADLSTLNGGGIIVKTFDDGSKAVTLLNKGKFHYSNISPLYKTGATISGALSEFPFEISKIGDKYFIVDKGTKTRNNEELVVEWVGHNGDTLESKAKMRLRALADQLHHDNPKKYLSPDNYKIPKMAKGSTIDSDKGVDLFEDYDQIPANLQLVLDKHEKSFEDGSYKGLEKALIAVKKLGYTFEYDLSGSAYDLRKIGQKGKSEVLDEDDDNKKSNEQFAKGSTIKSFEDTHSEVLDYLAKHKFNISALGKRNSIRVDDKNFSIKDQNAIEKINPKIHISGSSNSSVWYIFMPEKYAKGSTVGGENYRTELYKVLTKQLKMDGDEAFILLSRSDSDWSAGLQKNINPLEMAKTLYSNKEQYDVEYAKGANVKAKKYVISYEDENGYEVKTTVTKDELKLLSKVINITILKEYGQGGTTTGFNYSIGGL